MDAGAWWAAIYGVAQSRTRLKRLSSSSSRQKYSSSFLKWKRQKQNLFPRMGMEPWGGFRVVVVGGDGAGAQRPLYLLDHLPSLPAGGCWPWASASSPRFPSHWEERVAQVVSSISASSSPGQASSLLLAFYSLHLHSASSPSCCLSLSSRLHPAQVFRSQNGWTELKGMVLRFLS